MIFFLQIKVHKHWNIHAFVFETVSLTFVFEINYHYLKHFFCQFYVLLRLVSEDD